jgi:1-acyl-sn-glycerol-3-phosphate acyltransferase
MNNLNNLKMINFPPIDSFLAVSNFLHMIAFLSIILPVDSLFKKPILKLNHWFALKLIDNNVRTVVKCTTIIALFTIIIYYGIQPWSKGELDEEGILRAAIALYTLLSALLLQKTSDSLAAIGTDRVVEIEQEIERANMVRFQPPSKNFMKTLLAPQNTILPSDWTGLDNVSKDTPALYVMNHSLYGLDMSSFVSGLYLEKDVYVRGLADHFHFCSPHGSVFKSFGAVDGTRDNVDCLMDAKQNVLVYPGGGQEVLKNSSVPKYSLLWKERLGFARMAIKHGYPIVPCASVGVEDMIDILGDINLESFRKGQFLPIPGPLNPTRLQKLYFWVGEPIPTAQYKGDWKNDTFAREVRDQTKAAVEKAIQSLQEKQQTDPDRFLVQRFGKEARDWASKTIGRV